MAFVYSQKIKFRHCDPAGIVFYPRYFEMINDTVEAFFDGPVRCPFASLHPDHGIPTVQIETTFSAPSRLGDALEITLEVVKVGRTSLGVTFEAMCETQRRFTAAATLVWIDGQGRPTPWPAEVKGVLAAHLEGTKNAP